MKTAMRWVLFLGLTGAWLAGIAVEPARADTGFLNEGSIVAWGSNVYLQWNVPAGNNFTQVAAGANHSLALRSDGSLAAWGSNSFRQLDNVPTGNNFTQVAGGANHSLALKSDGSLAAWGDNGDGQLINIPTGNFTQVAAGRYHSVALRSDGSLAAWGNNGNGQLNNIPTGNFTQVAAGGWHSLALKSDGSLAAWGANGPFTDFGQCNVPTGNNFTQVAGGYIHSVALRSDGSLAAWGDNSNGQLKNIPTGNFTQVAAGGYHSLALKSDGSLAAWGDNISGQCDVPTSGYFLAVAAGNKHSLALKARDQYQDLLVTGSGTKTLLQRSINVSGNATIETAMAVQSPQGPPVMTVAGLVNLTSSGSAAFIGGSRLVAGGLQGTGALVIGDQGGVAALTVGSSLSSSFNGTIADAPGTPGSLVKVGSGAFTLSAPNSFSGGVMIQAGSLVAADRGALGTGNITLAGGSLSAIQGLSLTASQVLGGQGRVHGDLDGDGRIAATGPGLTLYGNLSGNLTSTGSLKVFGIVSPGHSAGLLQGENLNLGGAELVMELGGRSNDQFDRIVATNSLTVGDKLDVRLINSFTPQAGDSFDLFGGAITGQFGSMDLPTLGNGLSWDTSRLYTKGVLSVVPEPGTWAMLAGMLVTALAVFRRRVR